MECGPSCLWPAVCFFPVGAPHAVPEANTGKAPPKSSPAPMFGSFSCSAGILPALLNSTSTATQACALTTFNSLRAVVTLGPPSPIVAMHLPL
jgi:hypothetical protein